MLETFERFFMLGMKRDIGSLASPIDGPVINLGAGIQDREMLPTATHLAPPDWYAPDLEYGGRSIAQVHAHHFFEHLDSETFILTLREIERVLAPGGLLWYTIPYAGSHMSLQDITHKSFFNEDTFKELMQNPYYDPAGRWALEVVYQVIVGINGRNLALMGQMVKLDTE